jgi:hypothetical protein
MNDLGNLSCLEFYSLTEIRCGNQHHLVALIQGEKPPTRQSLLDPITGYHIPYHVDETLAPNEVRTTATDGTTTVYINGART